MKLLDLNNWGIQRRVMVLAMIPLVTISLLLGTYMISERVQTAYAHLNERGALLAEHLAPASEFPLFSGNLELLRNLAASVANEADVSRVRILDSNKNLVVEVVNSNLANEPTQLEKHELLTFKHPIGTSDLSILDFNADSSVQPAAASGDDPPVSGWVAVDISTESLKARQAEIIVNGILLIGVGLFLSAFVALRIGESVVEPMLRLVETVMRLRNGELDARVEVRSGGEVGLLEEWINAMAFRMQASQQALRYRVNDATRELRQAVKVLEEKNYDLEKARKEALEAGRVKTEFLANMSHEIRTPLNAVIGYSRLLQESSLSREQRDYARTISQSASLLLFVIDDILNFSKLESGKIELENISFDLQDCMEDMVSMLSPTAHDKKLEIVLLLHSEVPQVVYGDPVRLSQITANYVNNAIKFTNDGGITLQVSVEKEDDGNAFIRFAVTDTGIGLREDERANLFKPFSQADNSISRRFGGTGLGLSICKHLVSLMGGTIGVESDFGVGSTFWAVIPFRIDSKVIQGSELKLKQTKILLCDPHPFSRRSVRNTLLRLGATVYTTGDFARIQEMLEGSDGTAAPYTLLVIGLGPSESDSSTIDETLVSMRAFYSGPLMILISSHSFSTTETTEADSNVVVMTKPARRDALYTNIQKLGGVQGIELAGMPLQTQNSFGAAFASLRVLVAEDNEFNRSLIATYLNKLGITPQLAENGKQALELATANQFDIVFLDIHMPVMDGIKASARIRALSEYYADVPVVAMTADVFVREEASVDTSAFSDYLFKPIKAEELVGVLFRQTGLSSVVSETGSRVPDAANASSANDMVHDEASGESLADGKHGPATISAGIPDHLVAKLIAELPEHQKNLENALADDDIPLMREHAHQLYGLCGYFGVDDLANETRALQNALHQDDKQMVEQRLISLNAAIQRIVESPDTSSASSESIN